MWKSPGVGDETKTLKSAIKTYLHYYNTDILKRCCAEAYQHTLSTAVRWGYEVHNKVDQFLNWQNKELNMLCTLHLFCCCCNTINNNNANQRWWLWAPPGIVHQQFVTTACRQQRQMTLKHIMGFRLSKEETENWLIRRRLCFRCGHTCEIWGQRSLQRNSCLQRRTEHMVVKRIPTGAPPSSLPPSLPPRLWAHLTVFELSPPAGGAEWDAQHSHHGQLEFKPHPPHPQQVSVQGKAAWWKSN